MKREFLQNFKVNGVALPDVMIDAIMQEHTRDLEAATANPGANGENGGKTFTQEDVNRIVSERLAREREKLTQQPQEDEREMALKAREQELKAMECRLECRDYLDSNMLNSGLLKVFDTSDTEKFKAAVENFLDVFPSLKSQFVDFSPKNPDIPLYASGTGIVNLYSTDRVAEAFKPDTTDMKGMM